MGKTVSESKKKKLDLEKRNLNHKNSAPPSTPNYNSATTSRRNLNLEEEEQHREKKPKLNSASDGSDAAKGQSPVSGANPTSNQQGTQMDLGPSTALPDQNLLLFILDRLQKKDTYSVFSEPVDPIELPDYHENIERPMDFGTVRKKLASGAYATLEHFEKDIFLICSNAMRYNSPDTIYFRQARSIQGLATKSFGNLRHDSDDNEPEHKVVRRGRPPLKKPLGRPPLERTGSEFSDEPLASYDMRKGAHLDKSGLAHSSHDADPSWLTQNKFDKNDELSGSMLKGTSMKLGRKLFVLDENRRQTYKQFHPSAGGREPSVLATFRVERTQLMAVGVESEQGYARSLALFAASLGPVVWKIASKRIERSLSLGIKFGPGWVGENDILPQRPLVPPAPPPAQLSSSQPVNSVAANKAPEPITVKSEAGTGPNSPNGIRPRPQFPVQQGHLICHAQAFQQKPKSRSSHQEKQDIVPPDLNIRFQSPNCGKMQSDLSLQL